MNDSKSKTKVLKHDSWDHRFVYDCGPMGTRSLPLIKAPKPYISTNGSVVKSVLRTNAKDTKRRKHSRDQHRGLEIITSSLTPTRKKQPLKPLPVKGSKISALQKGKIKSLRSRARPFSLPIVRDTQSPLPLGIEKSYSARDSSSRTSMLKIDVSDMDSSIEKKQWDEFKEITEDCEVNNFCHLTRLYCVGKGSSAYVYKSVLFPSLQIVADKVVAVASQDKSSQIIRELNSLRALLNSDGEGVRSGNPYSKNIVRLLEVYPNPRDGTISICLEYMAGGSLQDVLQGGGCQDENVLVGLSRQIMSGISFLHSHRHIHRDVKPGNILIGSGNIMEGDAVIKISDFGIAKELEKGHSLADSFLGTFHYMSPERIAGKDYSFSSDIWGCGLSILAVAMGCYPFSKQAERKAENLKPNLRRGGEDDQKNAEMRMTQDHGSYWHILQSISQRPSIKSLLGRNHSFSTKFCTFLSKCLHRDKDQRASADSLLSSHPFFVGDQTQDSSSSISQVTQEHRLLREFVMRCCAVHRDKLRQNLTSSSRLFPTIKQKQCISPMFLDNVNVVLMTENEHTSSFDSKYECFYYNQEDVEDIKYFFVLLSAYKDFISRNWKAEGDVEKKIVDMDACETLRCVTTARSLRAAALTCLLDTTLSVQSLRDNECTLQPYSQHLSKLMSVSPTIRPLFDQSTFQNLSDQFHVPIFVVKICLRDFVIELLKPELSNSDTELQCKGIVGAVVLNDSTEATLKRENEYGCQENLDNVERRPPLPAMPLTVVDEVDIEQLRKLDIDAGVDQGKELSTVMIKPVISEVVYTIEKYVSPTLSTDGIMTNEAFCGCSVNVNNIAMVSSPNLVKGVITNALSNDSNHESESSANDDEVYEDDFDTT